MPSVYPRKLWLLGSGPRERKDICAPRQSPLCLLDARFNGDLANGSAALSMQHRPSSERIVDAAPKARKRPQVSAELLLVNETREGAANKKPLDQETKGRLLPAICMPRETAALSALPSEMKHPTERVGVHSEGVPRSGTYRNSLVHLLSHRRAVRTSMCPRSVLMVTSMGASMRLPREMRGPTNLDAASSRVKTVVSRHAPSGRPGSARTGGQEKSQQSMRSPASQNPRALQRCSSLLLFHRWGSHESRFPTGCRLAAPCGFPPCHSSHSLLFPRFLLIPPGRDRSVLAAHYN